MNSRRQHNCASSVRSLENVSIADLCARGNCRVKACPLKKKLLFVKVFRPQNSYERLRIPYKYLAYWSLEFVHYPVVLCYFPYKVTFNYRSNQTKEAESCYVQQANKPVQSPPPTRKCYTWVAEPQLLCRYKGMLSKRRMLNFRHNEEKEPSQALNILRQL